MMAARPRLFLDVDGVVNAVMPLSDMPPDFEIVPVGPWDSAVVRPAVIEIIRELASIDIDVTWHTSWHERAQEELAPALGLPDWPATSFEVARTFGPLGAGLRGDYKTELVLAHDGEALWVDDEASEEWDTFAPAHQQRLQPDTFDGLTVAEARAIVDWARAAAERWRQRLGAQD